MLFDQILDGFVCVFYFFLPGANFLGTWTVRVYIGIRADLLLFEALLVHFINKKVNVFTHLFQLISQLFILGLQILLLSRIVP